MKQTNSADFLSVSLYIQAIRLTCNYQFKLQSRRFVQDLFEKILWTDKTISILEQMHGLCFTTPIQYELRPLKVEEEDIIMDSTSISILTPVTPSSMVVRGKITVLKGGF